VQRGEPLTSQTGGSLLPAPAVAFRVGQREARSLSERWSADPAVGRAFGGSRPSTRARGAA